MDADEAGQSPSQLARPLREGHVPAPAIQRLCLYLRELEALSQTDQRTISSKQLGQILGLTDAQVRKDLAYFGQFGYPGIGYRVDELATWIRRILGTDRTRHALLVGAGNLGRALLSYGGFTRKGFRIVAAFDADPARIGQPAGSAPDLVVQPMDRLAEVIRDQHVEIAILCVPAAAAQGVADQLVRCGIKGILNFAPATLNVPEHVALSAVDLALHFEQLAFWISARQMPVGPASQGESSGEQCLEARRDPSGGVP